MIFLKNGAHANSHDVMKCNFPNGFNFTVSLSFFSFNFTCHVFHCRISIFPFVIWFRNRLGFAHECNLKRDSFHATVDFKLYGYNKLTSNTGIVCNSDTAKTVKCNSSHFTSTSCSMLVVTIILWHGIRIVPFKNFIKKKLFVNFNSEHVFEMKRQVNE